MFVLKTFFCILTSVVTIHVFLHLVFCINNKVASYIKKLKNLIFACHSQTKITDISLKKAFFDPLPLYHIISYVDADTVIPISFCVSIFKKRYTSLLLRHLNKSNFFRIIDIALYFIVQIFPLNIFESLIIHFVKHRLRNGHLLVLSGRNLGRGLVGERYPGARHLVRRHLRGGARRLGLLKDHVGRRRGRRPSSDELQHGRLVRGRGHHGLEGQRGGQRRQSLHEGGLL